MDDPHRRFTPPSDDSGPGRDLSREYDRDYGDVRLYEPELPLPAVERPPPPSPPLAPSRRRSWLGRIIMLAIVLLIVAGIIGWVKWKGAHQTASGGRFQSASQPVGTAKVAKGDMPVTLSALGTVTPLATVTVQSQINGQLLEVGYKEGQMVQKGDFLAQIDPRPYQVALEQAQAQLAKDQAALRNAQVDLDRYRKLVAENSIARQTLDTQVATVQQDAAVLQADQAQIDTQKLNLVYCHITAPVSGRIGLRLVDPGNYVQASSTTGLVVITQLQPISVIFTVPEDSLNQVLDQMHAGKTLQVTAFDRTGAKKLDNGHLETVDNQIDTTTGTVKLRAIFDNPGEALFPNQFVNIQLLITTLENVPVVPVAAVQRGAPGTFVYIVKPDSTVKAQPVTLGPSDQQNVSVTKGVQDGDQVVTDGADRLKDGGKVRVTDNPTGQANPGQAAASQSQLDQSGSPGEAASGKAAVDQAGGSTSSATSSGSPPNGAPPSGATSSGALPSGALPSGAPPSAPPPGSDQQNAAPQNGAQSSGQDNADAATGDASGKGHHRRRQNQQQGGSQ